MANVLVVDDNAVNRDLVVTLLGYQGHRSMQAADGMRALATARAERPDLIITDLLMPLLDGYELIREIRSDKALADTPVIFYTANYLHSEVRPIAAALGVRHIVSKPIDVEQLMQTVENALADLDRAPIVASQVFDREHQRALSAKLLEKVHELEQAENALRESEARFRSLAEFSPIGILSMGTNGRVSYANPRLREICGIADTVIAGDAWDDLVHPEDRELIQNALALSLEGNVSRGDRLRLLRPDGEQRWVKVQVAPVVDQAKQTNFVATVEDITEVVEAQLQRDEMERRLRASERLESLGELAAGVAHDFNNLLAVIVSYAQFVELGLSNMAREHPDPRLDQMQRDTDAIRGAADRAAELTRQLLIFARRDIVHPEVLDVNGVVSAAVALLGRTIGEHVQLEHDLADGIWPVTSDRGQLDQVLVNLVVNARDAVGDGGVVKLTTDNIVIDEPTAAMHGRLAPGHYVRLTVSDDGMGMVPETISRAFEPFFTTKPTGEGTGLGLSTVYGIVTRMGGSVSIYSERGHGTAIRVYLPACEGHMVNAGPLLVMGSEVGPAGSGAVILVNEDDDEIRAITARILTENGYEVVTSDRGALALELISDESNALDLLLSDVIMPQMSGRELAERAAEIRPDLPVLFMSGYADGLLAPARVLEPGVELLEKPFTQATLLAAVANSLRVR